MKALIPKDLTELSAALAQMTEKSKIIGGGTDLIIRLKQQNIQPDFLLYMGNVKESKQFNIFPNHIEIGSSITMAEIAENKLLPNCMTALKEAAEDIGSVQIRNRATIGGNIANASPAGDLIPVFYLLNAKANTIDDNMQITQIPIRNLIMGSGETSLKKNQAIFSFEIPITDKTTHFIKMGYRQKVTIARINIAAAFKCNANDIITDADIVASAIYETPLELSEIVPHICGLKTNDPKIAELIGNCIADFINRNTHRVYKAAAVKGVAFDLMEKFRK